MRAKTIGALVVSLSLVTTGGVFAAWNFAGSNAGSGISAELQFGMENVQYSTSRGTYSVTTSGQKIFTIDQALVDTETPSNNDYTAVLVVNPQAVVTIKFTPNKGASSDIIENGLPSEFFFSFKQGATQTPYTMDADGNYTTEATPAYSIPIVTLNAEKIAIYPNTDTKEEGKAYWTPSADGKSFTYELNATDIAAHVQLNNAATKEGKGFVLDTIEEYYAFGSCLDAYSCAVVVTDTTPTDTVA